MCELALDNFRLGSLVWELSPGTFGLGTFTWKLSLGVFALVTAALAWELSLGISRLENWIPGAEEPRDRRQGDLVQTTDKPN